MMKEIRKGFFADRFKIKRLGAGVIDLNPILPKTVLLHCGLVIWMCFICKNKVTRASKVRESELLNK